MPKPKTHFEQVPLEVVLKIAREEVEGESDRDAEIDEETLKNGLRREGVSPIAGGGNIPTGRYRNKI